MLFRSGLVLHQVKNPKAHITIDSIADFRELTDIKIKGGTTGLFMIGGGVPKNFVQDTVVCAEILGVDAEMHKYAVQITVADVRDGEAFVWTGGQKPHFCRDGIAKMFNLPQDKVKVTFMTGPGSYGRNDSGDATMDAAVLSKAVGKPVRVQYMRVDGTGWDPKSPASVHTGRAAIDKDGKVIA